MQDIAGVVGTRVGDVSTSCANLLFHNGSSCLASTISKTLQVLDGVFNIHCGAHIARIAHQGSRVRDNFFGISRILVADSLLPLSVGQMDREPWGPVLGTCQILVILKHNSRLHGSCFQHTSNKVVPY